MTLPNTGKRTSKRRLRRQRSGPKSLQWNRSTIQRTKGRKESKDGKGTERKTPKKVCTNPVNAILVSVLPWQKGHLGWSRLRVPPSPPPPPPPSPPPPPPPRKVERPLFL